jgi:hypothetical protein
MRIASVSALCLLSLVQPAQGVAAQGVASATVSGSVRDLDGAAVDDAGITVLNTSTGVAVRTQVQRGRFTVRGLEPGGPYVVEVRHIGFLPQRSQPLRLGLGEPVELGFVLKPVAIQLEALEVTADPRPNGSTGAGTTISSEMVHGLPTLDRSFYDFVALAPLVSSKVGGQRAGVSAAGANLRYNSYLINGADERFVNGNVSAASNVGKSVPLDAVKEYQVLVAPYDVRYGEFAGAMVNTVTESGTNDLRGSVYSYWRNDRLARISDDEDTPHDRLQLGLSLGGPIVRDRVHFFVASEMQRLTQSAAGPYLGQSARLAPAAPVREADVARMANALRGYGLEAGSGGPVENRTPLFNLFARVDAAIPRWSTRATGFVTYAQTRTDQFTRSAADTFALSSYQFANDIGLGLAALRVQTDLPRAQGGLHELLVSFSADHADQVPAVRQPLVQVVLPGASGQSVTLTGGSAEAAQGRYGRARSFKVRDGLSIPWGAGHVLVAGLELERFRILRGGVPKGYGVWTFLGLENLELGAPHRKHLQHYVVRARTPLGGGLYPASLGQVWGVGGRLSITTGLRAELLDLDGHAPYNPQVDSIFDRRTDLMPRQTVDFSPRLGFTWNLAPARGERLRGGVGIFTGRPPPAWLVPALANHGEGIGVLRCGFLPNDAGPPPAFVPDYRAPPTRCATGAPLQASPFGAVDLLDPGLRMARVLRTSLAYERVLPGGVLAGAEILVSRHLSDFVWTNLNLQGPQGQDRFGRVLYGTHASNGIAQPALRSRYAEVIELRNTSHNYAFQVATRLERRLGSGFGVVVSYTWSRTRDVQSPSQVNAPGLTLWGAARALSGRHDDETLGISLNDLPHRIVAALAWTAPWGRWPTHLALYYVGESGSPFTYLATGTERRGDLNADGSNLNDPIYVPRSAFDSSEIRFDPFTREASGAVEAVTVDRQAAAFERFIEETPCLRRQRGRIAARNSCREPWTHTTIASVRQGIPIGRQMLELELDAFNLLDLLSVGWGRYQLARPGILEHVGQATDAEGGSQPIFRFDPGFARWETLPAESAFQLQVAARFRF